MKNFFHRGQAPPRAVIHCYAAYSFSVPVRPPYAVTRPPQQPISSLVHRNLRCSCQLAFDDRIAHLIAVCRAGETRGHAHSLSCSSAIDVPCISVGLCIEAWVHSRQIPPTPLFQRGACMRNSSLFTTSHCPYDLKLARMRGQGVPHPLTS